MAKAVILLNMGGARSANELKTFLFNMFMDKRIINSPIRYLLAPYIAQKRYKKVWKNYELIGGSRLHILTQSLANKLSDELKMPVEYAMRYTRPKLKSILQKYDEVILLPLYPQYSTTTVESSLDDFKQQKFTGKSKIIPPFYWHKDFNRLISSQILSEIKNPETYHLIFSAHGLPQSIIDNGDPYQQQLEKQVHILKTLLPAFKSIKLAYQSRFGNKPWLQPYLDESLADYKNEKVIIYPLSFMIDNSETDLELKIEYAQLAHKIGIKSYKVISCLNDSPQAVQFLSNLIRQYDTP